jgi:hypothetical protein
MNENLLTVPLLLLLLLIPLLDLSNMLQFSPSLMQKGIQKVDSPMSGFQTMRRMLPAGKGKSGNLLVDTSQSTEHPHSSKDTNSRWKWKRRNVSTNTDIAILTKASTNVCGSVYHLQKLGAVIDF